MKGPSSHIVCPACPCAARIVFPSLLTQRIVRPGVARSVPYPLAAPVGSGGKRWEAVETDFYDATSFPLCLSAITYAHKRCAPTDHPLCVSTLSHKHTSTSTHTHTHTHTHTQHTNIQPHTHTVPPPYPCCRQRGQRSPAQDRRMSRNPTAQTLPLESKCGVLEAETRSRRVVVFCGEGGSLGESRRFVFRATALICKRASYRR